MLDYNVVTACTKVLNNTKQKTIEKGEEEGWKIRNMAARRSLVDACVHMLHAVLVRMYTRSEWMY